MRQADVLRTPLTRPVEENQEKKIAKGLAGRQNVVS
jgi:hypothetical protein